MKIKCFHSKIDFERTVNTKEECALCMTHKLYEKFRADDEFIQALRCPNCQELIPIDLDGPWHAVGETNVYDGDENLEHVPIVKCVGCGNKYGVFLGELIHNADHDIYYTGGNLYFELPPDFENRIMTIASNYTDKDVTIPREYIRDMRWYMERIIATILKQSGLRPF